MENQEQEVRTLPDSSFKVEMRADGKKVIVGRAIVYNQLSQNLGWFREQIDAKALDNCDMADVVGLFNHDNNLVLGRTLSGTMTLEKKDDGLYYTIDPPKSAASIIESIERGDVRGSSFAFITAPGGADWDTDPATGGDIRTVKKIARLIDVSPVTQPAYLQTNTDVAKRSLDEAKKAKAPAPVDDTEILQLQLDLIKRK
jgi:HK97 family phage prohead protease